jgi:CRP/FNR family transcriptional regulator, cyclic AMP receptor protein
MNQKEKIFFLKQTHLFSEVTPKGLALVAKYAVASTFEKNSVIFNEGESGTTLYIIKSGKVKITKYTRDGKTKTLAILKENDNFGEMALLTKDVRSATVEALTRVVTLSITAQDFEFLIKSEPTISLQIIKTLCDRLAKADRHIRNLALGDARTKIAEILVELAGGAKEIKTTHQEIADLAGITRETTTRVLIGLEKEEIIQTANRRISVRDFSRLKEMCL